MQNATDLRNTQNYLLLICAQLHPQGAGGIWEQIDKHFLETEHFFNVLYRWPHTYWITIFVKITASRKKPPVQTVKTDCRWWPEECWEHLSLHTQGWSSELQHCWMMTTGFFLNYVTYVICNSVNIWAVREATSWGWHCHECFSHLFFVWMSCMG